MLTELKTSPVLGQHPKTVLLVILSLTLSTLMFSKIRQRLSYECLMEIFISVTPILGDLCAKFNSWFFQPFSFVFLH